MNNQTTETLTHSSVGASSCSRWWNCPGSNGLIAKLPPAEPTQYAAEGTVAHAICEHVLKNKVNYNAQWDATALVGEEHEADGFTFTVTEEMADAVNVYVNAILKDIIELDVTVGGSIQSRGSDAWKKLDGKVATSPYVPWINIEKNFVLDDVHTDARGTNDASIFYPGRKLIVYDFKYGRGIPVEVKENKQLMYYALGAAGENLTTFEEIELVIIQPRAEHKDGIIRRWATTPDFLLKFKQELKEHIEATYKANAPTCAGGWCRFCNAKVICPSMRDKTFEIAKMDFSKITTNVRQPQDLTTQELKLFLDNADILENYISDIRKYAFNLLNRGEKIEGYKLVRSTKTHRKWKEDTDFDFMAFELGIDKDKLYSHSIKTPKQVEDITKGIKDAKKMIAEYVYRPEGELKLVKDTDMRQSELPSAVSDFIETKKVSDSLNELGL